MAKRKSTRAKKSTSKPAAPQVPATPPLDLLGICRFSFLGKGDWTPFHLQKKHKTEEEIVQAVAQTLFTDARLEERFKVFEDISLPSMAHQSDKDFTFYVMSSEEMPAKWQERLNDLCAPHSHVKVVYKPVMRSVNAFKEVLADNGHVNADTVQFRLDDDDAVSVNYIEELRRYSAFYRDVPQFELVLPNMLVAASASATDNYRMLKGFKPHMAVGQAIRHPARCAINWAHSLVHRHMTSVSSFECMALLSYREDNDTGPLDDHKRAKLRAQDIEADALRADVDRYFPFFSEEVRTRMGLTDSEEAPQEA